MGKHRSSPSGRKNPMMRKRGIELLCAVARPPQECWSIRERINFRIALARFGKDWPRVAQFIATKTTDQKQRLTANPMKKLPSQLVLSTT
ncbi:hypothetical protein GQ55_2G200500 [Panicum hallii var. hallii]|uniref:Myb-like domain-containing protein n=1 Tax=Panicum hallii var. hallii TaxID=1504633 RepID=A0A2T7EQM9_9POAL|nr:hypothetical protein GQ55_2G200500 [Panicum hallii var. hallii]